MDYPEYMTAAEAAAYLRSSNNFGKAATYRRRTPLLSHWAGNSVLPT